jgi:hypothetical protein
MNIDKEVLKILEQDIAENDNVIPITKDLIERMEHLRVRASINQAIADIESGKLTAVAPPYPGYMEGLPPPEYMTYREYDEEKFKEALRKLKEEDKI